MRNLVILISLLSICLLSGCSASVLIPPLPGPMMIPSSVSTVMTAYSIGADERGFQTIVEDEMLETSIRSSMMGKKHLSILDLSTYAYNGNVYIVGEYDDKKDFQRIRKLVKKNPKVNSLTTYLFAKKEDQECSITDNYMLEMAVKTALLDDQSVWGTNFAVKSVQCNIILLGRVADINEAITAKRIAANIEGVRSVKSFVRSSKQNRYTHQRKKIANAIK